MVLVAGATVAHSIFAKDTEASNKDVPYLVTPNSAEMKRAAEKIKEVCAVGDNTTVHFSVRGKDGLAGDKFVVDYYCSSRFK